MSADDALHNLLLKGAAELRLDPAYLQALTETPKHKSPANEAFVWPTTSLPSSTVESLFQRPTHTAFWGAVFDMTNARPAHNAVREILGGKDMTLFWLQRMDSSAGNETFADIVEDRLSPAQREYLNGFLHEYDREYRLVGQMFYRVGR